MANTVNGESFGPPSQETLDRWAKRAAEDKSFNELMKTTAELERRKQDLKFAISSLVDRQMELDKLQSEIDQQKKIKSVEKTKIARMKEQMHREQMRQLRQKQQCEHQQYLQWQRQQQQQHLEQIQYFNWLSMQAPSLFWMHPPAPDAVMHDGQKLLSPRSIPLPPGLDCEDVSEDDASSFFLPPPGLVHPSKKGAKNSRIAADFEDSATSADFEDSAITESSKGSKSGVPTEIDEWFVQRMAARRDK